MGLFEKKKKDAERCPICGKEISFFSGLVIADGTICDDCEKMVRGQFNIEEYYGRENWKISTSDPLKAMTVEELKDMINEKKAEQTQVVEEIGGDYAAIAKVEKTFGIAPKATDVGLKRAKACATEDDAKKRDSLLLTLGNLAIIPQALNASIRDAAWNVKKAGKGQNKPGLLLCASGLYTLHDVLQKNDWNEHEIENRAEWLLANAQNIWKI